MAKSRAPVNGALFGISYFLVYLGMIPNFIPKPIRLLILAFVGWATCTVAFTQTTGEQGADLGLGSAVVSQFFMALDYMFLTRPDETKNFDEPPSVASTPVSERSFKERAIWARNLFFNPRGIGWSHEPHHLPSRAPPNTPRRAFVFGRLCRAAFCLAAQSCLYVLDVSNPGLNTEGRVLSQAPLHWRALGVVGFVFSGICSLTILNCSFAIVAVGSGLSTPDRWPNLFGWPGNAWSVQRLWRRVWHQTLRRSVTNCTAAIVPTRLTSEWSKLLRVFIAFFVAAISHVPGEYMLTTEVVLGRTFRFFMLQPFAIIFERLVSHFWNRLTHSDKVKPPTKAHLKRNDYRTGQPNGDSFVLSNGNVGLRGVRVIDDGPLPALWKRCVGYAWVVSWFAYTIAYMVDPMCTVGMFVDPKYDLRVTGLRDLKW